MNAHAFVDKVLHHKWALMSVLILACIILIPIVYYTVKRLFVPVLVGTISVIIASIITKLWMDRKQHNL